jgi:hypothetical protein
MHLLLKKCQKTHFLNGFSTRFFQLLNGLDLVDVYHYHSPQKNSLQNSTHNFNFDIYLQFFILHDVFF